MLFFILMLIVLMLTVLLVWYNAEEYGAAEAVMAGLLTPILGFFVVLLFIWGPVTVGMKTDNIEHSKVQSIERVVYLASSNAYLVDVDLGNGVNETIRLDEDSDYELKISDRDQLVERTMIFDGNGIVPWTWTRPESTILLVKSGTIEVQEGM